MAIDILDSSNFKETINSANEPIIIDFYADWCGPCKMIAPILEDISNTENVKIYKLNVDDNQDIATEYEVMTIPSLISFKNGEVLKRIVGLSSKEEILELAE